MALTYFINRKKITSVISLNGSLTKVDTEVLDKCLEEILSQPSKYIILNLSGFTAVSAGMGPALIKFQQKIREPGAKLYLCNLTRELAAALTGLVVESEVKADLLIVLQIIMKLEDG